MDKAIPISWINRIILASSLSCIVLCIILQQWLGLSSLPIYVPISWAVIVTTLSTWLSCYALKRAIKANAPINLESVFNWLGKTLGSDSQFWRFGKPMAPGKFIMKDTAGIDIVKSLSMDVGEENQGEDSLSRLINEIDSSFVRSWYTNISDDKTFPEETKTLLRHFFVKLNEQVKSVDKVKLVNQLADVFLLHFKEYRRALRRVEKGTMTNVEIAYRRAHSGSRGTLALEYSIYQLISVITKEFLHSELAYSLPYRIVLSIISKRVLLIIETVSSPGWILKNLLNVLNPTTNGTVEEPVKDNAVSSALSDGIFSATAAVIPRPLPKTQPTDSSLDSVSKLEIPTVTVERASLSLEGLTNDPGLSENHSWEKLDVSENGLELDEDKVSPVYEESTNFASTIARLRCLLQQKSTATTPLPVEEKSCIVYEGCQFTNLAIPRTEFYTAADGSQQLLYCIQFDDIEQHGVDTFETTTATVRRQYSEFVQLHQALEKIPTLSSVMSEIVLPEGGRTEMETYLRTLCTKLSNESPTQLRHFLRPNSGSGKKADAVAPSFDKILAKIVSGTFNTLKTVVNGFEVESEEDSSPMPTLMPLCDIPWRFVQDIKSKSLMTDLQKLIDEKVDYCNVETAYEAVDPTEISGESEMLAHWWETVNTFYDEEIDGLDSGLSLTCTLLDLICDILSGIESSNTLQQEAVVRWVKYLFGNVTESMIQHLIFSTFSEHHNFPTTPEVGNEVSEETVECLENKLLETLEQKVLPYMKFVFGEEDSRKIFKFFIKSFHVKNINEDLCLQLVEVFASQLLAACRRNHHIHIP